MINQDDEILNTVRSCIADLSREWRSAPAMIITEFDLQAQLLRKLAEAEGISGFCPTADREILGTKVHGEIPWFDENGGLTIKPDLTIMLELNWLSITRNLFEEGVRLPSKQCSFGGDAIIIEIKFHRNQSPINNSFITSQNGIQKDLDNIKRLLSRFEAGGERESIYAFSILFDRSDSNENELLSDIKAEYLDLDRAEFIYTSLG